MPTRTLLYKKIDAFTDGISSGNPAGVVYIPRGESLSGGEMQEIARQFTVPGDKDRVSEVAFCTPSDDGSFILRYYSYTCEVELCGHATIALMYDLIKNDRALSAQRTVVIRTAKAVLPVINDIGRSDSVYITAPVPEYRGCPFAPADIAGPLGIPAQEFDARRGMEIVNGGLFTAVVPLRSRETVVRMRPDERQLKEFSLCHGFDVVIVHSPETFHPANRYRTRVFCPKYGYLEDPATGSGNAALGYYLLKNGSWDGGDISIEQGPDAAHPNIVKLKTEMIEGLRRVQVGGNGVVRSERQIAR